MSFNFMAAVTIHSDFGAQENKICLKKKGYMYKQNQLYIYIYILSLLDFPIKLSKSNEFPVLSSRFSLVI